MLTRRSYQIVAKALARQAAVAIIGPRQVGKTTLAHEIAEGQPSIYLDLESRTDREKLTDPEFFLKKYEDRLVILDEIHRVPELFQSLRGLIDQGRRKGKRTGRFLILGSASIDLLKQSGETLAGRIEFVNLNPLNALEIPQNEQSIDQLWVRGGFPDSFLAKSDEDSFIFRKNFIKTYLERDIPLFVPRMPVETLERLWTMLAHNQGCLLNSARLASGLSVSVPTINSYVGLFVDLLLVRRLMPYHTNTGKRLIKSPKVFIRDSGLVHTLLGIANYEELLGHPVVGGSWEGCVIENILAAAPYMTKSGFYRTSAGAEIDLLLELPANNGLWAIEIKKGLMARPERGFYNAIADLNPTKSFVVYSGVDRYPINERVEAIGLLEICSMLSDLSKMS